MKGIILRGNHFLELLFGIHEEYDEILGNDWSCAFPIKEKHNNSYDDINMSDRRNHIPIYEEMNSTRKLLLICSKYEN